MLTPGHLRYFLTDAWDELRHSPAVNLLAVATLAAALFVAALVLLVLSNLNNRLDRLRADVRVDVFLREGLDDAERQRLGQILRNTAGVARVEHVDQDEALRRYRHSFGTLADVPAELGSNPLPPSFEVSLRPGPDAAAVAENVATALAGESGVEEVLFDRSWLDRLEALLRLARSGGGALALPVLAAVVFVMASVLRLAVYARRDEIGIMLLVGATPGFVRGPFLVAGLFQGLLGALGAIVLIEAARRLLLVYGQPGPVLLLDFVSSPLPPSMAGLLLAIGPLVSVVAAFFAVRSDIE